MSGQEGSFAHQEPIAVSVLCGIGIVTGFTLVADRPLYHPLASSLLALPREALLDLLLYS